MPEEVEERKLVDVEPELHDADDDDDNWSRQVETDESHNMSLSSIVQPTQVELSLKEKLVHRERQLRLETERARLKQQFVALNETQSNENQMISNPDAAQASANHPPILETTSSHAGTLGEESTKAHHDPETVEPIGLTMERFLRNSDTLPLPPVPTDDHTVMERFLNQPVEPNDAPLPQRSVSFEDAGSAAIAPSVSNNVDESNHEESVDSEDDNAQPRVLQLTEADMRELEAIDEVSIGNAPPSEREDTSIVGDLHDFPAPLSQGTTTTVVESSDGHLPTAALPLSVASTQSVPLSPGAAEESCEANPPSQRGEDSILNQSDLHAETLLLEGLAQPSLPEESFDYDKHSQHSAPADMDNLLESPIPNKWEHGKTAISPIPHKATLESLQVPPEIITRQSEPSHGTSELLPSLFLTALLHMSIIVLWNYTHHSLRQLLPMVAAFCGIMSLQSWARSIIGPAVCVALFVGLVSFYILEDVLWGMIVAGAQLIALFVAVGLGSLARSDVLKIGLADMVATAVFVAVTHLESCRDR